MPDSKTGNRLDELKAGRSPIYEPGLEALMERNIKAGRLLFTDRLGPAVAEADVVFLAVGTPMRRGDGYADLSYVYNAVEEAAPHISGFTVITTKSTVPVGTNREIERRLKAKRPDAEFAGLDLGETRRAVEAGWRILRLAGLEPKGFVAPAYAYTPALHATLASRFSWWAGQTRLYRAGGPARGAAVGPALALGSGERSCAHCAVSPWLVRVRAATAGRVLRLDISPRDLEPRRVGAIEAVLQRARVRGRVPVTLDDVALG